MFLFADCQDSYLEYQGSCVKECALDTYVSLSNKGKPNCRDCHYTCSECKGPLSGHCLGCHPDARLRKDGTCLLVAMEPLVSEARWYFWLTVAFVANVGLIAVAGAIFLAAWWKNRAGGKHDYEGLQGAVGDGTMRMAGVHYESSDED